MKSFWQKLKRPFFCLAPMADVTDPAFRRIIAKYGKLARHRGGPDVFWTEFVSADGLCHPEGRKKLLPLLQFSKRERPIVAQIFGANPETIREAARIIASLGFDGVDLNMGCPDKAVEKQGAGAALIKNPKLARELIRAAKEGAKFGRKTLPVSVKTRLGYRKDELDPPTGGWLSEILAEEPAAVTIHARTRQEMSKVPAHWERVRRAVEIRNELGSAALIIGNGDVIDLDDARKKATETGADGIMLGRAIFGNPFLFAEEKRPEGTEGRELILKVLLEHSKLFEKLCSPPIGGKSFAVMKKHFKAYVTGWPGAKELRQELMEVSNASGLAKVIHRYLKT